VKIAVLINHLNNLLNMQRFLRLRPREATGLKV
jgi:hypothetical protein